MQQGPTAVTDTGMPESHGRVFQSVADRLHCVIASREVGKWATGLLLESYATKGFHNKAKSCPWGPMAGFVLADPRFTKNKDTAGQRGDLQKAIKAGGDEMPLYITEERRKFLHESAAITRAGGTINDMHYAAAPPSDKKEGLPKPMTFVLRRTMDGPGAKGKILWAVLYGDSEARLSNDLKSPNKGGSNSLLPVMAMIDAACPADVRATYRAATTGDYDLWAVFPRRSAYSPGGADKRMVPGSDRYRQPLSAYIAHEDQHRGNLTARITRVRDAINAGVRAEGYMGGDVVHHSDEAGRPMVSNIDFPFVAFVPGALPCRVSNVGELKEFLAKLSFKYVISLNPGWHRQLGIEVSKGGAYTV